MDNRCKLLYNCCQLGYSHFAFSRKTTPPGVYAIYKYCNDDHLEDEAYCDNSNGGVGWLVIHIGGKINLLGLSIYEAIDLES